MNLAQTNTTRPSERQAEDSTIFDAVRAALVRVRKALQTDPEEAARGLEVVGELLDSTELVLTNVAGLALGAEEKLGAAAVAFARVDHIASDGGGYESSADRTTFSLALGDAVDHLRCIPGELANVAELEMEVEDE